MTELRLDDWYAANGSIGGVRDKHRDISFTLRPRLARAVLEALYEQHAIVARVIDKIVDDAFEAGWRFKTITTADGSKLDQAAIKSDLDDLHVDQSFAQSAKWSRLFGGGLSVIPAVNSGAPWNPLKIKSDTVLLPLVSVPEERARPLAQDVGIFSPNYGRTLKWQIDGLASSSVNVHHSRVFVFEPIKLPLETQMRRPSANGWGPSILERMFDELGRDGAAASHAVSMMYIASILYVKLKNYRTELTTKDGRTKVRAMLTNIRERLDSMGIVGLDAEDAIGNMSLAITGAHELMDRTRDRVCAVANYPREVLYNESPAGLNAGELSGPRSLYHKSVVSWWGAEIKPHLNRFLEIYFKLRGLPVTKWEIELCPLWAESDREASENHARNAAADTAYITAGVLSADVVLEQRFVQGNAGQLVVESGPTEPDLELDPADVEAHVAAEATTEALTPADTALNGAQGEMLMGVFERLNTGVITYEQAVGAIGLMFPTQRGREAVLLGPPRPAVAAAPAAPATGAQADEGPVPADVLTVQAAAAKFGLKTRSITRAIETGRIRHWGFGANRVVSLGELASASERKAPELEPEDPADPNDQGAEV